MKKFLILLFAVTAALLSGAEKFDLQKKMEDAKKEGWGGKRPGAGRPKGTATGRTRIYRKVNLSFLEDDYDAMRKLAENSGKSFSRFIADSVLGREG